MAIRDKQIAVRVAEDEKVAFEEKAKQEGKTPSQVLLEFVQAYIGTGGADSTEESLTERVERLEAEMQQLRKLMGKQIA
jgi:hypothetical protein